MTLAALADIHEDTRYLLAIARDLQAADLVLLLGDLTRFGRRGQAARVVEAVQQLNPHVLAVAGNCDHPEVNAYLTGLGINLHARSLLLPELAVVGLGGSLPCPGRTPWEFQEQELATFLQEAVVPLPPNQPLILVSHQPPFQTAVDRAYGWKHVGSRAVRAFIEQYRPLLCLTGHIHEGRGSDRIGTTPIINPGPFWQGSYAWVELARAVDRLEIRWARRRG